MTPQLFELTDIARLVARPNDEQIIGTVYLLCFDHTARSIELATHLDLCRARREPPDPELARLGSALSGKLELAGKARFHHAGHYLGWSEDLTRRLELHRAGRGAKITRAAVLVYGLGFRLVRTWSASTRADERRLKRRKNAAALCPRCSPPARG